MEKGISAHIKVNFIRVEKCYEVLFYSNILWYVDPLLGNDNEISSYTAAIAK
jgi:hypothetical protein